MKRNYPGNEVGLFVRSSVMLARFYFVDVVCFFVCLLSAGFLPTGL